MEEAVQQPQRHAPRQGHPPRPGGLYVPSLRSLAAAADSPVRQHAGNKTTRKSAFGYPRVYPCKWNKSKGKCQIRTAGTKWKKDV